MPSKRKTTKKQADPDEGAKWYDVAGQDFESLAVARAMARDVGRAFRELGRQIRDRHHDDTEPAD